MSPSALSAQRVNKQTGFKQVGEQEEEEEKEEGRGVGMEQVSDPPGDLALDTPARGKGGKETSEKRPNKPCWAARKKKKKAAFTRR